MPDVVELTLGKLLQMSAHKLSATLGDASLVLVRSQEIDFGGEIDSELFARRWQRIADEWRFDGLNELIRQHNDYYPIERDLPVDPGTGEYVKIVGRSYRREPLGPEWILERFPADP